MNATADAKAFCRKLSGTSRAYAQSYLLWLCQLGTAKELERSPGYGDLSFVAAQAIRIELREAMGISYGESHLAFNRPVEATPEAAIGIVAVLDSFRAEAAIQH